MKRVGVLALQGDFQAHVQALERCGAQATDVRTPAELDAVDGLVIPGGESTSMLTLLRETGLYEPLRCFGLRRPIYGTCAGAIIVARQVYNPRQDSLGLVDICVERNAYGRQLDSRIVKLTPDDARLRSGIEAVFIRSPIIRKVGGNARILARYNGDPVLVDQGRHLVSTFHPELTGDTRVHRLFLDKLE